jgi:hypothetical protein
MARIEKSDVQGWVEKSKLPIETLDAAMLTQLEAQIIGRLGGSFDTSSWTDHTNTPTLVKSVIAMTYASWHYNRAYSEDQEALNDYALWLLGRANDLLTGIIDGSIIIDGVVPPETGSPSFYPNDNSSALDPTCDDTSLGDAKFSMGSRF